MWGLLHFDIDGIFGPSFKHPEEGVIRNLEKMWDKITTVDVKMDIFLDLLVELWWLAELNNLGSVCTRFVPTCSYSLCFFLHRQHWNHLWQRHLDTACSTWVVDSCGVMRCLACQWLVIRISQPCKHGKNLLWAGDSGYIRLTVLLLWCSLQVSSITLSGIRCVVDKHSLKTRSPALFYINRSSKSHLT